MSTQVSVYNVRDRISPSGHTTFHILDKSGAFQEEAEIKSHVFTSWTYVTQGLLLGSCWLCLADLLPLPSPLLHHTDTGVRSN